jgi:hypothetical protein
MEAVVAYDNTNRGVLFVNDRKEKDGQPDRTGSLNVDGVEYFLDGWLKTSESGRQFLSVSVKRKEKQPQAAPAPRSAPPARKPSRPGEAAGHGSAGHQTGTGFDDMDDSIPF